MEGRSLPSNIPVLVIPGEAGSFPLGVNSPDSAVEEAAIQEFVTHLGLPPTELTAAISTPRYQSGYDNLINSLEAGGYQLGVDLFVVAQDWRLPIAPLDGRNDGWLSNLTAGVITDTRQYNDSTQYLGYWLMQAEQAWEQSHGGQEAPYVDVISHSEGYLIARSYISSPAYGGAYINAQGQVDHLPKIGQFISLAGPNEGVAQQFNNLHNNFYAKNTPGFQQLRYEIDQLGYYEVAALGRSIDGPDGKPLITRATIADPSTGQPSAIRFLQQFFQAGHDLTATYAFLNGRTISNLPNFRNDLLLDLNAGRNPNTFARTVGNMTALFGYDQTTITHLTTRQGRGGLVQSLAPNKTGFSTTPHPTQPGQVWYAPTYTKIGGDGTVPIESLVSTFVGDPRVTLMPLKGVTHVSILSDPSVQSTILSILAQNPSAPNP
jgi:hypothetical protein